MSRKRSLQFHRTVSVSQLSDCGGRNPALEMETTEMPMMQIVCASSEPAGQSFHHGNASLNSINGASLADADMKESMRDESMEEEEVCFGEFKLPPVHAAIDLVDGNPYSVPMDEEGIFPSLTPPTSLSSALRPLLQASHLQNRHQNQASSAVLETAHGSVLPPHFLDACNLCSKRLGHGKDVFIYRGDRAFCSVECRQFHILADERREKCGFTSLRKVLEGPNNRAKGSPSTPGHTGTATVA